MLNRTVGPKIFVIFFICFYLPFQAAAWGVLGHRIIGEIAASYLTPKAKKEIAKILGNASIAMSSNWADFIKSDTAYNYLYNWHFININDSMGYDQFRNYLEKDTAVDAYTKLNFLIASLKSRTTDATSRLMYLRLLIHIAGDLHQPMHVGKLDDLAGNRIRVQWFGQPSNLHRVWDEQLVEFQQLSYTEYAAAINFTSRQQRQQWQQQPISEWLFETYQHCRRVYRGITQNDQKLSYRYNFDHVEMLNAQLLKGGVRLAGILNQIFV
jgi:hypothetical protein